MPCMERFNREAKNIAKEILPKKCRRRVAIEAGVPEIWYQYVGLEGKVIGLHRFGLSAPGQSDKRIRHRRPACGRRREVTVVIR